MLEPGKKQVVKWTAEGAVKCDLYHRVFCDAAGKRNMPGICWYPAKRTGHTVNQGGTADSVYNYCIYSSLTESLFLSGAFLFGRNALLLQNHKFHKEATAMNNEKIPYKIYLTENEMPRAWYNLRADMQQKPAPLLNPATHKPMTAAELSGVFCEELVAQELDNDTPYFEIPEEIRDFYKMYRPAPLVRAYCLEKKLGTPAKIYYKFEGNNTSGSHKLNSAIAQAYYAKKQGLNGVTTETGAGQWGTALSMACSYLQGLHGEMLLRAETLPPGSDAHLRCVGNAVAFHGNRSRPEDPGRTSGHYGEPRLRYFRGGGDGGIQ